MTRNPPQRTRQHQLETESKRHFESVIPSSWIYRPLDQDYGIDGEVEIFDDSGDATGYKFLVQLKGTDQTDIEKGLRLRLPLSKVEYYDALNLPVLIVRYHAPSGGLYCRWFHALDPYYIKQTEKSITINFSQDDVWTYTTPRLLHADVEAYSNLKSSRFPKPLRIAISFEESKFQDVPAYVVLSRLRELGGQISQLILFETSEVASNKVLINNEAIIVKIAGACTLTLHTRQGYTTEDANSRLHFDIIVAIGLAIANEGHFIEAAEIVAPFLIDSKMVRTPEIAVRLLLILSQANKIHTAFEVSEELFKEDKSNSLAESFILLHLMSPHITVTEKHFVLETLKRIADEIEKQGDLPRAGRLRYNIANSFRGASRLREAVSEYRNAARLDSSYHKRHYFWQELAGVLFENGRFKLAAKLYGTSLTLEERKHTRLLYADALMFSGEYLQARKVFEKGLSSDGNQCAAEWHLKLIAISWLSRFLKLDRQDRKTSYLKDSFQPSDLEDSKIEQLCLEMLASDALCSFAWFNLGVVHNQYSNAGDAAMCFLLAALIVPQDLESWTNAFVLAWQINNMNLAGWVLKAAYEKNGESVIRTIVERFPDNREDIYLLFSQILEKQSIPNTRVFRMHEEGGRWHEIDLADSGSSKSTI